MARHFVDTVEIHAKAGRGGNGACTFRRESFVPRGGPDGGDGGHGGSVCLRGDEDVDSLISLLYESRQFAECGSSGAKRRMHGRNGRDLVVSVPLGTSVKDAETDYVIGDVTEHGQVLVVARGGQGGLGNVHWKRADHQVPREFTPGEDGEEKRLRLDLKIVADAGLVGFPSAGKSSILRGISRAKPKVAAYPFTTLNPMIGTVEFPEHFSSVRVADIPGLIENAHLGVGLGLDFLRHIERSRVLVIVIDMAGVDGRKPEEDYKILLHELEMRDSTLLDRPRIVVANKMDLPEAADNLKIFKKKTKLKPIEISAGTGDGLETLKESLYDIIKPPKRKDRKPLEKISRKEIATIGGVGKPAKPRKDRRQRKSSNTGSTDTSRKGYTPPAEKDGRGEHPDAPDVISADKRAKVNFFKI